MMLTVASFNIHGGRDRNGAAYDFSAALSTLSADIVMLQETWETARHNPIGKAAAEMGYTAVQDAVLGETTLHTLGISYAPPRESGRWGLAVLSRLPVAHHETVTLGTAPGDIANRLAQIVTLTTQSGSQLRIVNAHLTHRAFASPFQLRALSRRLGAVSHTIIGGDLNTVWPLTGLAPGYRRVVQGKTWPAHRPVAQLDHLLIGGQLRATAGKVLDPVGSDHRPVLATITIV